MFKPWYQGLPQIDVGFVGLLSTSCEDYGRLQLGCRRCEMIHDGWIPGTPSFRSCVSPLQTTTFSPGLSDLRCQPTVVKSTDSPCCRSLWSKSSSVSDSGHSYDVSCPLTYEGDDVHSSEVAVCVSDDERRRTSTKAWRTVRRCDQRNRCASLTSKIIADRSLVLPLNPKSCNRRPFSCASVFR